MIATNDSWHARVGLARAANRIGDLLLLADEAPAAELRADTWIEAAAALRAAGHDAFARELLERALVIDAGNAKGLSEQALCRQGTAVPNRAAETWQPRQVFVFSGHMIDAPDRPTPRFPANKVAQAAQRIAEALERLAAGSQDLALTQGACGGDLLFTEACRQRGVKVFWLQPFAEPEFIAASVVGCGEDWHRRYLESRAALAAPPRAAPEVLGQPPRGSSEDYPYERCNLWLLYTALVCGPDKVSLVCLWNGAGTEGAGGTGHMVEEVKRRSGRVCWIDTRSL